MRVKLRHPDDWRPKNKSELLSYLSLYFPGLTDELDMATLEAFLLLVLVNEITTPKTPGGNV